VVGAVTVTFLSGSEILGTDNSAPYEFALNQTHFAGSGTYPLYAVLTDDVASYTSQVSFISIDTMSGLPFEDGFDVVDGYTLGDDLNGKAPSAHLDNTWVASGVAVTDSPFQAGGQAAALSAGSAVAQQTFHDGQTDVWTDLYIQPVFADMSSFQPQADSSVAFSVNTSGQVMAFNGSVLTQLAHAPLTEQEWVRFTVHSDYAAKTWDLYLNDGATPIGLGLGFFDATAAACTELQVRGEGAVIDEINIGLVDPRSELGGPQISGVSLTGGEFSLSWDVQSGMSYTIWWTDDLLTGWPEGQVFPASNGSWTDPNSSNVPRRFYRLMSEPTP
jgi:hypothetical protein